MRIEELNIEVIDVSEYEYEAGEILTAFCNDLECKGMAVEDTEHDESWREETGIRFWWKPGAGKMIREKIDELYAIGKKYFPENEYFNISSHMYREP